MKANARPGAQSEAPGWSSGGGASPAPRTRKPGQSAHDWSTQGVFPWVKGWGAKKLGMSLEAQGNPGGPGDRKKKIILARKKTYQRLIPKGP